MKHILKQIDFVLLAGWTILYPVKHTKAYFLGFGLLAAFILVRIFAAGRHIVFSRFSLALCGVNLLLLAAILGAPNRQNALLMVSDLILAGLVVTAGNNEERDRKDRLLVITALISFASLVTLGFHLAGIAPKVGLFFANPIHQGVLSGLGALLAIQQLVKRFAIVSALFLAINLAGVWVSASKAAFIGIVIFALLTIPLRRRRWFLLPAAFVLVTILVPNPVRHMFHYSIKHDSYAANRIDIWKMSLRMTEHYFPRGTGLGSFGAAAPLFNFPQEKGPARYFKVPRRTHNDYLKIIVEGGVFGIGVLLILGIGVILGLMRRGIRRRSGPALLYLLFQAFLFNLVFEPAFLLIFLFLLDDWLDTPRQYHSPLPALRISLVAFVGFVTVFSYILPFLAERHLEASRRGKDFMRSFQLAHRAARLTPLDAAPHKTLAQLYCRYDRQRPSLSALASARRHLVRARRLNPYAADTSQTEALILETLITRNLKYPGLEKEIFACLDRAMRSAPLDPFVRMHRARIRFEFNHGEAAKKEARAALELEPRFLEARVFLQRHFPQKEDPRVFRKRAAQILALRRRWRPGQGTYLAKLFSLPPADRGWLRGTFPGLWPAAEAQKTQQSREIR